MKIIQYYLTAFARPANYSENKEKEVSEDMYAILHFF